MDDDERLRRFGHTARSSLLPEPNPLELKHQAAKRRATTREAAVAAELRVAAGLARVAVHAISTRMFKGNDPAPVLADALDDLGLGLTWDSPVIGADLVVLHNPSFLRFQNRLDSRIVCRDLVVVTHEKSLVNHFDKRVIMIDHGVVAATGVGRYEVAAHA